MSANTLCGTVLLQMNIAAFLLLQTIIAAYSLLGVGSVAKPHSAPFVRQLADYASAQMPLSSIAQASMSLASF
jgi:hypothetical protein